MTFFRPLTRLETFGLISLLLPVDRLNIQKVKLQVSHRWSKYVVFVTTFAPSIILTRREAGHLTGHKLLLVDPECAKGCDESFIYPSTFCVCPASPSLPFHQFHLRK